MTKCWGCGTKRWDQYASPPHAPVKILFLLYIEGGGNCAARFIMSLTVRCEGSLYIMCSMWPHYSPSTHLSRRPGELGFWPCKHPPVSFPEAAGEDCLLARVATGPSCTRTHTQPRTKSKPHPMHKHKGTRIHMQWLFYANIWCLLALFRTMSHTHTRTYVDTHAPNSHPARPAQLEDGVPFLAKVLWAVISKTIPWMAALIENNEGHIEHMVAVVSPFPPSSLFFFFPLLSHTLSPRLSTTPPDKRVQSNFARAWQRCATKKGRCQSCCSHFFFFLSLRPTS